MSVISLTKESFDHSVLQAEKPVLVDFWAPWCGPCQMMGPVIDGLAEEMETVVFGKVNVDEEQALAQEHNILSIPTFLIFQHGQVVDQFSGAIKKEELRARLEKYL